MARKTVRIDIPKGSPDGVLSLMEGIIAKEGDPTGTPKVDAQTRSQIEQVVNQAKPLHLRAAALFAEAQGLIMQRDRLLGLAPGQTMESEGTGLFLVASARDQLLTKNKGVEENLSAYGFNVVVGTAKGPARTPKTA